MKVLSGLKPEKVFEYFEQISTVPRGSGNTDKISNYCVTFAKEHGLKYIQDELNNVIIFKGGSKGRENEEPVILQGHLDMVWEKNPDCDICFESEGLRLKTNGEFISAEGTTLGGDDGIAVAICLAILDESSLSHPPLEVVFTVDEEIGMLGATGLDTSPLKGKKLINLDSESESVLWVSCAGGCKADIYFDMTEQPNNLPAYQLKITGLHGGHSGAEIHKGYANATCLMGMLLKELSQDSPIYVSELKGGKMSNAITRECSAVICTESFSQERADSFISTIKAIYMLSDPDITLEVKNTTAQSCFDLASGTKLISFMASMPYGVIKMSDEIEGLVQTSLNPGIAETEGNKIHIGYSVRSSVNEEKYELITTLEQMAAKQGATMETGGDYSAWEYKKDSPLRDKMTVAYKELFGKDLEVTAIHAGLECGILAGKIDGLDCVSIGPDMQDIHTPSEKLSIPSTKRIYDFVVKTLEVL